MISRAAWLIVRLRRDPFPSPTSNICHSVRLCRRFLPQRQTATPGEPRRRVPHWRRATAPTDAGHGVQQWD